MASKKKESQTARVTTKRALKKTRASAKDFVSECAHQLQALTSTSRGLVLLLVAGVCLIGYANNAKDNVLTKAFTKMAETESVKPLATWLQSHIKQVVGLICYGVPVFARPRANVAFLALAAYLLAFFLPEATVWEYGVQAVGLHLLLTVRGEGNRICLFVALAVAYGLGWLLPSVKKATT